LTFENLERKIAELHNAELLLDARTDVAWIGLRTMDWSHSVAAAVGKIVGHLEDLKKLLAGAGVRSRAGAGTGTRPPAGATLTKKVNRISELVQQMAAPPRPVYDEPEQTVFEVNKELLYGFIDEILKLYRLQHIHIGADVRLDQPAHVKAAAWWLQCVIGYAVKNSVDAAGDKPTTHIVIAAQEAGGMVEISIRDNGPGIPEHLLPQLTERPVAKEQGGRGLGIGLWVMSRIMQIFGGSVRPTNVKPHGAMIVLALPLVDESAEEGSHG